MIYDGSRGILEPDEGLRLCRAVSRKGVKRLIPIGMAKYLCALEIAELGLKPEVRFSVLLDELLRFGEPFEAPMLYLLLRGARPVSSIDTITQVRIFFIMKARRAEVEAKMKRYTRAYSYLRDLVENWGPKCLKGRVMGNSLRIMGIFPNLPSVKGIVSAERVGEGWKVVVERRLNVYLHGEMFDGCTRSSLLRGLVLEVRGP